MSSARETAEKVWQKICEERGLYDAGVKAITAALLAEREACAKVADEWEYDSDDGTDASAACSAIAAAIRARQ